MWVARGKLLCKWKAAALRCGTSHPITYLITEFVTGLGSLAMSVLAHSLSKPVGGVGVGVCVCVWQPSFLHGTCCFPSMPINGVFLRRCKQGALQFVFMKPVLALVVVSSLALG
jgi:hypothetical protein